MVSQKDVFSLVYDAAKCFIPMDELTEEQREKLEYITFRSCSCRHCRMDDWLGHANKRDLEICWSKPFFGDLLEQKSPMDAALIGVFRIEPSQETRHDVPVASANENEKKHSI
jgi:hypothetical protein